MTLCPRARRTSAPLVDVAVAASPPGVTSLEVPTIITEVLDAEKILAPAATTTEVLDVEKTSAPAATNMAAVVAPVVILSAARALVV